MLWLSDKFFIDTYFTIQIKALNVWMAGVCWLYLAMRNYSDESIAIKLKYFGIYVF